MSSLNAARADNFYYAPDWVPGEASKNELQNEHHLGKRAKKIGQGIIVIRFEMPFNVWCTTCNSHIGKGVRYNAEKKQVGKYFSSKIFEFSMPCHICFAKLRVQTDPENRDYKLSGGLRRKIETYSAKDAETVELLDQDELAHVRADPMRHAEHKREDKGVVSQKKGRIRALENIQDRMKDDFGMSQLMRRRFRTDKKTIKALETESKAKGLGFTLLPRSLIDKQAAAVVSFASTHDKNRKLKRMQIRTQSIFGGEGNKKHAALVKANATRVKRGIAPLSIISDLDTVADVSRPITSIISLSCASRSTTSKPKRTPTLQLGKQTHIDKDKGDTETRGDSLKDSPSPSLKHTPRPGRKLTHVDKDNEKTRKKSRKKSKKKKAKKRKNREPEIDTTADNKQHILSLVQYTTDSD